jgi:Cu(I)/Ag(I) efflux system protein CusF
MKTVLIAATLTLASLTAHASETVDHGHHAHMMDQERHQAHELALTTAIGTVRKLDRDNKVAIIAHEPVPSLGWPAMVMPFQVADEALAGLEEGETVTFAFSADDTKVYEVH